MIVSSADNITDFRQSRKHIVAGDERKDFFMAWLLVVPVFVGAFVIEPSEDYWIGAWDVPFRAVAGFLAGLLAAASLWFASSFLCCFFMDVDYVLMETKEIVSLDSRSLFDSGFHPISGQAGIDDLYYFIEKDGNVERKGTIDAYYASIIRSDRIDPCIEFYSPQWAVKGLSWFASPMADDMYKIYVPENSLSW